MISLKVRCLFGPPESGKSPKSGREPCVQCIFILDPARAFWGLYSYIYFINPSTIARDTSLRSVPDGDPVTIPDLAAYAPIAEVFRSEEHTSELQSRLQLVCRLLL